MKKLMFSLVGIACLAVFTADGQMTYENGKFSFSNTQYSPKLSIAPFGRNGQMPAIEVESGILYIAQNANYNSFAYADIYSGAIYQSSDARFKTDIKPVESATGTIKKLRPVTYKFTNKVEKKAAKVAGADGRSTGFLAQEVAQVLPNSVAVDENGDYLVDYISIIPLLVKTVQEREARIAKLEQQLNAK